LGVAGRLGSGLDALVELLEEQAKANARFHPEHRSPPLTKEGLGGEGDGTSMSKNDKTPDLVAIARATEPSRGFIDFVRVRDGS
jgi:hypothetical protein